MGVQPVPVFCVGAKGEIFWLSLRHLAASGLVCTGSEGLVLLAMPMIRLCTAVYGRNLTVGYGRDHAANRTVRLPNSRRDGTAPVTVLRGPVIP